MDFDALMAQARANEEQVKKTKPKKPCNLEPGRSTQKLRHELVRKQEEEKRRKIAEQERFGRQEREKLARMEAAMEEHERKLKEEQEKMDRLDQIHKEAQERKAKMEAEQQAKRDAVRQEQERKREEEREKKRQSRAEKMGDFIDDDDDIFKRRQRELDEKKRRREQRKKDDIWRRREEHKRGSKERDKERLMAKIREDAKKVAMSLSKGNLGAPTTADDPDKKKKRSSSSSTPRLLDIQESAYQERKRAKQEKRAELKKELRIRRASEIESRAETSSSSGDEIATKPPRHRRRESSGTRERTPVQGKHKSPEPRASVDAGARSPSVERCSVETRKGEVVENGDLSSVAGSATREQESSEKPKISDILGGNVNTAALSAALSHFIKFPSGPIAKSAPQDTGQDEQEKLQELFGDTESEGEGEKDQSESEDEAGKNQSESEDEAGKNQSGSEDEENESPVNKSQDRRNKLKELARRKHKHSSSDSLSDYDHKEYEDTTEDTKRTDKPKTFEEILAVAKLKDEENRKELELKKQKEQKMHLQKKEKEAKRKELREEIERKRKEAELEQERAKLRAELRREEEKKMQEQMKEERAKSRIPKVTSKSEPEKPHTDKHTDRHTNKLTDSHKRPTPKQVESKQSLKTNGSSEHPSKRKKMSAPIRPDPTGSFEELMRLAQDNSKQATFGSSIRKPEDVLREQKKKEAQRERDKQQYLNFKPTVPLPPPKHKQHPPRPSSKPPEGNRSVQPSGQGERKGKERGKEHRKEHRKEQRSSDREQRGSDREQRGSDREREQRRMKEAKRRHEKPRKKMHPNPYMDDDLDDFVVDDGDEVDYSKAVRNIFGYDKRRYRDEDDDCRDMETDYRTIAKEEARSARLAKQEDAEELKKILAEEERERKRKMKR